MELKGHIFKELKKNGYSERENGGRVWNIANRSFLYMSQELADAFLKLRAHPRYKATILNIEMELLASVSGKFLEKVGDTPCNLVDMGCGDGRKTEVFVRALEGRGNIRFCPISPGEYLVNKAIENVKDKRFENIKGYKGKVACLDELGEVMKSLEDKKYKKNVVLLLGSILASFDIHDYLFTLSQAMNEGDCLIIGNAIRQGDRLSNIENYRNPLFEEWLFHLMREIGFEEKEVEYGARFENSRVEGFYKLRVDKKIIYAGEEFEFKKGDEILVAILYKYYAKELEEFCKMYFKEVDLYKDKDAEQAIVCCIK